MCSALLSRESFYGLRALGRARERLRAAFPGPDLDATAQRAALNDAAPGRRLGLEIDLVTAHDLIADIFCRSQDGIAGNVRLITQAQFNYLRDLIGADEERSALA